MIHDLPRTHRCRYGVPAIVHVDSDIFVKRYFMRCEVTDESLICLGSGPTLYQAMRDELRDSFGGALVEDLDHVELSMTSTDAR